MTHPTNLNRPKKGAKPWKRDDKVFAMGSLRAGMPAETVCATLKITRKRLDNMLFKLQTSVHQLQAAK